MRRNLLVNRNPRETPVLVIAVPGHGEDKHNTSYSAIELVGTERKGGDISITICSNYPSDWYENGNFLSFVHAINTTIDGLPGRVWVAKHGQYQCSFARCMPAPEPAYYNEVKGLYRLDDRNNDATGTVELDAWVDNATLPHVMQLVKTLHITESIAHTIYSKEAVPTGAYGGYTHEPIYVDIDVPHTTYTSE
ncbi:MAG: hypothetical protein ACLPX5_00360 [Dissulfurispiraceae bacterium]